MANLIVLFVADTRVDDQIANQRHGYAKGIEHLTGASLGLDAGRVLTFLAPHGAEEAQGFLDMLRETVETGWRLVSNQRMPKPKDVME